MPLYEYRCSKCGAQIEKIRKFSDPPLSTCKKCGGKLERLVSSPAIQFKGSGWYVTDYARKSAPAEGDKPKPTEAAKSGDAPSSGDAAKSASPAKPAKSEGSNSE